MSIGGESLSGDLQSASIVQLKPEELPRIFPMLMEIFPVDRPIYSELIRNRQAPYRWTSYVLDWNGTWVGHSALVELRIWLEGESREVVGIASVATLPEYRRRGVARRLLEHCLEIVDSRGRPAALFTRIPELYEKFGFKNILQTFLGVAVDELRIFRFSGRAELRAELAESELQAMASLYVRHYPNYNGKLIRDTDYWKYYGMVVNLRENCWFLLRYRGGELAAYVRVEREPDRLLVAEFCTGPLDQEMIGGMLADVAYYAGQWGYSWITLAMCPGHFLWPILASKRVPMEVEPPGADRECFMVRPTAGDSLGAFERLQWSLADKF